MADEIDTPKLLPVTNKLFQWLAESHALFSYAHCFEAISQRDEGFCKAFPQGLKPAIYLGLSGTAEAVPFQNSGGNELFECGGD
jgi:hypothetical protein